MRKRPKPKPKSRARVGKTSARPLTVAAETPAETPQRSAARLIVALGASAGGLDAYRKFFKAMPPDSGMAFVLIQHLDPTHESLTAELLSRHTKMSVVQVNEAMAVEGNHVYVIPPNKYLSIRDGTLHPTLPEAPRALRMPIDFFLRTLAQDQRERAAGIILSGTGTDGTLGLKEIKAAGGLSIVQDPESAQYDGMPRSAVASDSVDHVVLIEKMPGLLTSYARHWYLKSPAEVRAPQEEAPADLSAVVGLLRARTKFDFGPYKKGTLGRRVHRRMGLRHVERLRDYLQLLRTDPAEVTALLVCFEDEPDAVPAPPPAPSPADGDEALVHQLEHELKTTREDLQSTIEELETSNEELKAANEEAMSVNEELQSLNEELSTVNAQLQVKVSELERTNDDLSNLLMSAGVATIFLDRQLRIRRFTPPATALFNLNPSDVGRPIRDIAQRFVDPELLANAEAVLDKLVPLIREVRTDEGRIYMRQVLPYRTQDDRIEGVVITFSDLAAERLEASRSALEQSESRLRGILNSAADGIITIDMHGVIGSFNVAAGRIFGYREDEVLGKNVSMLMASPYRDEHDGYLKRYRSTRQARIIGATREVVGRRKDGSEFPMELNVTEHRDRTGTSFIGIVRDISARKQTEQNLHQRQAELVRLQRVSTVGELAAGLSHELAQPLSTVINEIGACVRLTQIGPSALPRLRAGLERARAASGHAGEVFQHVRRLVENRPPNLQAVDLCDIVKGSVDLIQHSADARRIRLQLNLQERPLVVDADRVQIEQVLVNLLQNAIEAITTADGAPREIDVVCRQAASRAAEVVVHDTGVGLDAAQFAKLFEAFFTTKPEGLGMGLAISRSIIEAHGGRIWAEDPVGAAGTTVRFSLPLLPRRGRSTRSSR